MPYECLLSDSSASFGALYLIASYLCRVQAFAFEFLVYISVRIASSSDPLIGSFWYLLFVQWGMFSVELSLGRAKLNS